MKEQRIEIGRESSQNDDASQQLADLQGVSSGVAKKVALYQLIYSSAGVILGFICIIGGVILFFGGITGSTQWVVKLAGTNSQLSYAAPDAILFVVGLFVV